MKHAIYERLLNLDSTFHHLSDELYTLSNIFYQMIYENRFRFSFYVLQQQLNHLVHCSYQPIPKYIVEDDQIIIHIIKFNWLALVHAKLIQQLMVE